MKGTIIGDYNAITEKAAAVEREGSHLHAAKLWEKAARMAFKRGWASKTLWCENRMAFCQKKEQDRMAGVRHVVRGAL